MLCPIYSSGNRRLQLDVNTPLSSCRAGVWGNLVRQWLNEVLPDNAAELCR